MNTTHVVPEISTEMAALNLNLEDLTQSAYDLSSGGPGGVYMAQLSHFSVPNLSSNHLSYGHQYDLSISQSHDLSRDMFGHQLMTGGKKPIFSVQFNLSTNM